MALSRPLETTRCLPNLLLTSFYPLRWPDSGLVGFMRFDGPGLLVCMIKTLKKKRGKSAAIFS